MTILIGMDEAGYGPNLGPLCVAVSAWNVAGEAAGAVGLPADLYELLSGIVSRQRDCDAIAIADSKTLYHPGGGLRLLERGVHAALVAGGGDAPACWVELLSALRADVRGHRLGLPWHAGFDCRLPVDALAEEVAALGERLRGACRSAGTQLVAMRGRLVFPREFNELTDQYRSKGAALSHVTLGLLRELVDRFRCDGRRVLRCSTAGEICVVCDKHGGRNRYGELLQCHFPEQAIDTLVESRTESRYRWMMDGSQIDICFRTKGESFLPTALASMTAKYLRELAMRALNRFWRQHLPDLRPTAGYPLDAKRFKAAIATIQKQLGIEDRDLWRNR